LPSAVVRASPRIRALLAVGLVGLLGPVAGAAESATDVAREALAICRGVGELPIEQRVASLGAGLAMAERATLDDPTSALAWFASFCNRGKRLQLVGFSFGALGEIRRLRREIDRALEVAPDWPEALAGKGAMLVTLPRLLGGDVAEGERLLRRALTLDPMNVEARTILQELEQDAAAAGVAVARIGFLE
jgi:hypothetical protein